MMYRVYLSICQYILKWARWSGFQMCQKQLSARDSLRPGPGVKLTWKFVSSVVPSQTGGLMHAQARCHCKAQWNYLSGPVQLKPLAQFFLRIESCKRMSKVLPTTPGKVWHFMLSSVSGFHILIDVLLLGFFCQSIDQLDVAICRIKCHQQIKNSIQLNHFNN
jgi:hypothetical protein